MVNLSLLHNNSEPKCEVQCKGWLIGKMGFYPPENPASTDVLTKIVTVSSKPASTGTMTRIVTKASKTVSIGAMEQTKASKKNFLQICLFLPAFISFILLAMQTVMVRIIVVFLTLNVKISFRHIVGMHVKFSIIALTICKSHFCFFFPLFMCYRIIPWHAS